MLIKKAQTGCIDSRNRIVEKYIYLTKKVATRYMWITKELNDIEQEGVIGLFQAIDAYDTNKQCSFETYATRRIFTIVDEYILRNKDIHSTPLYLLKKLRSMKNRSESNADERHYDKNLDILDFNTQALSIAGENENGCITEECLSSFIHDKKELSIEHTDLLRSIRENLSKKEGGKYLLLNTLSGESISKIAERYNKEPYHINKKIDECLTEFRLSVQ